MPFPFLVILVAGATGYLLTALLFFITRTMSGVNPGAGWWGISSLAAAVGYVTLLTMGLSGNPQVGEALYNMLFLVWALGLYFGGRKFLGLRPNYKPLIALSTFVTLWLGYFYFIDYHFLASALAIALFVGVLNLHLATLFWKKPPHKSRYVKVVAVSLVVSGIHWLDYPFLRPIESFAPIGFSLCAILSVIISGLLAAMVLIQFRQKMFTMRQIALDAASRDPLTGLANRSALESHFEMIVQNSVSDSEKVALVFLDLDNFKPINDLYGHKVGDAVLATVASQIKSFVRESDLIARVGGDEFVIILTHTGDNAQNVISRLCENIIAKLNDPIEVDGHSCNIGVSIGAVCSHIKTSELDALMHLADETMYKVKAQKKGNFLLLECA